MIGKAFHTYLKSINLEKMRNFMLQKMCNVTDL